VAEFATAVLDPNVKVPAADQRKVIGRLRRLLDNLALRLAAREQHGNRESPHGRKRRRNGSGH
jgi:hypothetical protein